MSASRSHAYSWASKNTKSHADKTRNEHEKKMNKRLLLGAEKIKEYRKQGARKKWLKGNNYNGC